MKIEIPVNLKGKELTTFLLANKAALIAEKKSMPKFSDPIFSQSIVDFVSAKTGAKKDGSNTEDPTNTDVLHVKVVGNTMLWFDSQYDVLIPGCCDRTLKQNQKQFKFLHDHIYKIDAKVGEVTSAYMQDVAYSDLGLKQTGNANCLVFEADIMKSYNAEIFNQYKANKIDQHSIGLQYVQIDIAILDEDSPKELEFWNKWIDKIINKDDAIAAGFFFVVSEIKLIENSCVLFGANALTPSLEVTSGKSGTTKSVATYPGNDNAKSLMHIDKMMRRNKKSIETSDEYDGEDAETKMACSNMKYGATNSNTHLQQIKDRLLQGKSIVIDPLEDIQQHPHQITSKTLQATKFINLN